MEDTSCAQDAALNPIPDPQTKGNGNGFWKGLIRTVLGITISIILTFGTNALIQRHRTAKDRKMTAMMVMGNIASYADRLERCAVHMGWNDTLATYLLAIPDDEIDLINMDSLAYYINNVTAYYTLSYDQSAERIFSNSIDTWKNLGNSEFVENVGQCFSDINSIQEIYNEFCKIPEHIRQSIIQTPEAYQGKNLLYKALHSKEYRDHLVHIHSQAEYYHYLAAYLHWKNAINMELMGIDEVQLNRFIEERKKQEGTKTPAPNQDAFHTPRINPDALPDIKDWLK